MKIKIGDVLKIKNVNRVFEVKDLTKERCWVPDGWPIDRLGSAINPNFCEQYKGARSALHGALTQ